VASLRLRGKFIQAPTCQTAFLINPQVTYVLRVTISEEVFTIFEENSKPVETE
jgi:hypothetical protein